MIPAQFRVLVTRRPRYACRRCSQAVVQAHAPEHVVPGGLPTERLIAWISAAKFGDHLPFYRQAGVFARQGLGLERGTLGNWVGRACFYPVMRVSDLLCMDDPVHASPKGSMNGHSKEILDELLKGVERPEDLLGDAGLMKELKIRLMERMNRPGFTGE